MEKIKGFTLVELIIYMGILGIFLVVVAQMFVSISNVALESASVSSVQQDGRYLLSKLSYDIKRAQDATSPTSPAIPTPGTLGQTSNSMQLTIDGIVYQYELNGSSNLTITNTTTSETNQLNGHNTSLTSLTFQRLGNTSGRNSIAFNFSLESRSNIPGKGKEEKSFSTVVSLR